MRYMEARFTERKEAKIYRIYVTDSLQAIVENTARVNGGVMLKKRFFDLAYKEHDYRSGAEIIAEIKSKLKKVGENNSVQPIRRGH